MCLSRFMRRTSDAASTRLPPLNSPRSCSRPSMAATLSTSSEVPAAPVSSSSGLTQPARTLKRDLLTEHFRFAPETFAKGGMDLANRTMYTATAKVEQSLQQLVEKRVEGFDEEQVQRVRLRGHSNVSRACHRGGKGADTAACFLRVSTASRRSSKTRSTPSLTCSRSLSSETPSPSRTTCCHTSPCPTTCVTVVPQCALFVLGEIADWCLRSTDRTTSTPV